MMPELETLYKQAISGENLIRWLRDQDVIKDYRDSVRFSQEDQTRLQAVLFGDDLALFQHYLDNKEYQIDAESRMVFSAGLSIGLRLGSLCDWV